MESIVDRARIAVAHEWVSARAGSEKTFEALAHAFPSADLFALTVSPHVELETGGRQIETTFLDRLGPIRNRRGLTLPLMPLAWRLAGRQRDYDLVVTSSHACAKGFWPGRAAKHLSYVHAPMRYAWSPEIDARGASPALAPARALLRSWDRRSVGWVDSFAANSTEIAGRIREFYGSDAEVINPPVDTTFFRVSDEDLDRPRHGLLAFGRLIPYKRFDLAIRAASLLKTPLVVAGTGPEEASLRDLAASLGADVQFVGAPSDVALRTLYQSAEALLFPGFEDFGIVPVEAQAAGAPVVGLGKGGLLDTVVDGVTGVHCTSSSPEALAAGVKRLRAQGISAGDCRQWAERFSVSNFILRVRSWAEGSLLSS
jgi:glycosyltransferase involved in cell wall biosynthesis